MQNVFRIVIDEPKHVYSAGDFITGRVVLQSPRDEAVGAVDVNFSGRAKTKIRKSTGKTSNTYRGRGTLFYFTKQLYRGRYTLRSDRYEWPFEFSFPTKSGFRAGDDRFKSSPPFRANEDLHQLPPTFEHSGRGFATNFEAFIEYKLEATLTRPPESYKLFAAPLEQLLRLSYLPKRDIRNPDLHLKLNQQFCMAQTLRLLPEKADVKLSMKEKMKSTFKKSDLPHASFYVKLAYPTQVYPGGPFPLKACVEYADSSPDVPDRPTITLNSADVVVDTSMFVRATSAFGYQHDNDTRRHSFLYRNGLAIPIPYIEKGSTGDPSHQSFATDEWLDLSAISPRGISTLPLQTDFNTYNIAILNEIGIKLTVTCADKQIAIKVRSSLAVLPPVFGSPSMHSSSTVGMRHPDAVLGRVQEMAGPSEPVPPPPYVQAPTYDSVDNAAAPEPRDEKIAMNEL